MKNYLIAIIAIIGFVALIQGASADLNGGGGGFNGTCGGVSILSVTITPDEDSDNGVQVAPNTPSQCADVVKCGVTPATECSTQCPSCGGGCIFNAHGGVAMAGEGTHCLGSTGLYKCLFTPPTDACDDDTCAYNADGNWVGEGMGGYAYDQDDGYKMGLKTVEVAIEIQALGGIVQICEGGLVQMDVDNYDIKGGLINLVNPDDCKNTSRKTVATWKGNFTMHYWEKPGEYIVSAHVMTCCKTEKVGYATFEYMQKPLLCIAPQNKIIDYGDAILCESVISEALGDEIKSNCTQCDIGSEPATIRNIGNAVVNANIYATDLVGPYDRIPVSHYNGGSTPTYGKIWVDLGNGPVLLWDTERTEKMEAQSYCNKTIPDPNSQCPMCNPITVPIYGLPPGPHATNILSLKIDPLPCAAGGYYTQQIFLSGAEVESCCQDHREPVWPGVSEIDPVGNCITPPQCYELNRYLNLGMTKSAFENKCWAE